MECIYTSIWRDIIVASADLCLCLGAGVVVAKRSETLANQTWAEIVISTPDKVMSEPVHLVHVTLPAFGLIGAWSPLVGGAWF